MRRISATLVIALLVVLILLTYMFFFQVSFHEVAIKVRFGHADEGSVIRDPGLKFRWPWPIESIHRFDIRLRTLDLPETEIKTADDKNVVFGAYAVWQIENPYVFFTSLQGVGDAENQMRTVISGYIAAVVGQTALSDFVSLDAEHVDESYDRLLARIRDLSAPQLLSQHGIALREVSVRRISLPQETTQQVFESMRQERNKIAASYREEGKSQAAAIVAQATAEADQIMAFADRRAQEVRSEGIQAATALFEKIAAEDSEFFEWLRWLDALKAALAQNTTIFIDEQSPLHGPFVQPPVSIEPEAQQHEE